MKRVALALAAIGCVHFVRVPDVAAEDAVPITIEVRPDFELSNTFQVTLIAPENFTAPLYPGSKSCFDEYLYEGQTKVSACFRFGATRDAKADFHSRHATRLKLLLEYSSFFRSKDLIYEATDRGLFWQSAIIYVDLQNNPQCVNCMLWIEVSYPNSMRDFVGRVLPTMVSSVNFTAADKLARDVVLGQGWIAPKEPAADNQEAAAFAAAADDADDDLAMPAPSTGHPQSDDLPSAHLTLMAPLLDPNDYQRTTITAIKAHMAAGDHKGAISLADRTAPSADVLLLKSEAQAASGDREGAAETLKTALPLSTNEAQTKDIQSRIADLSGEDPTIADLVRQSTPVLKGDFLTIQTRTDSVRPSNPDWPPPEQPVKKSPTGRESGISAPSGQGENNTVGGAQ